MWRRSGASIDGREHELSVGVGRQRMRGTHAARVRGVPGQREEEKVRAKAQRSAAGVITSLLHEAPSEQRSQVVRQIGLRTVVHLAVSTDEVIRTSGIIAVEGAADGVRAPLER